MAVKKATTTGDIKRAAEPVEEGYTRVVAPDGNVTIVPNGIVDALLGSGYKRK